MPTPIVNAAGSALNGSVAADTASVVAIHNGGVAQTSDFPAAVPGTGAGPVVSAVAVHDPAVNVARLLDQPTPDTSNIQIPQTIVSQAAAPQVLVKATGNPSVKTNTTQFL